MTPAFDRASKHHDIANIAGNVADNYFDCVVVGTAISGGRVVHARRPFFAAIIFLNN